MLEGITAYYFARLADLIDLDQHRFQNGFPKPNKQGNLDIPPIHFQWPNP